MSGELLFIFCLVLGILVRPGNTTSYLNSESTSSAGLKTDWAAPQMFGKAVDSDLSPLRISTAGTPSQGKEVAPSATSTVEPPPPPKLSITMTGAWASKYLFRGFKLLNSGVYMHDIDMNLWDTGFHIKFQGATPSHDRG
jgi:hypothetical protein